ncbi:MAG: Leucine Rich Repeat (LRR)-containing protein [Phycisphaerales bacterium]|nr:Leucine Rich Repeat (LRR)-containing protein [Phycisphaerales bacterium]
MSEKAERNYAFAREAIAEAESVNQSDLNLSGLGLKTLPPEIGRLNSLKKLHLTGNQLTDLPPEFGNLVGLEILLLSRNPLRIFPPQLTSLSSLQELTLSEVELRVLPDAVGCLRLLKSLDLAQNHLANLPEAIGDLSNLVQLGLRNNQLANLPESLGGLRKLVELDLANNRLDDLPGALVNLNPAWTASPDSGVALSGNPLKNLPTDIRKLGSKQVFEYLRARQSARRVLWECKALIVGEGDIGKTWLYEALNGRLSGGNRKREGATVGIEIGTLGLDHPVKPKVQMRIHCWDFAGQAQNYATHQFFFHEQSLILLVWNLRAGHEAGRLRKWLGNLRDRAPRAKVILVGTQLDEPHADYPERDLRRDFPQVTDALKVSNVTGEGIDKLRAAMQRHAATMDTMGKEWPDTWWKGAEALTAASGACKHVSLAWAVQTLEGEGVGTDEAPILLHWLNALGRIVHYAESTELKDMVILDPRWLTHCIGLVLASQEVTEYRGILRREHLGQLWPDMEEATREKLVAVMNRFDLAYEIPDDPQDRCVVVEKLPQNSAPFDPVWESVADRPQVRLRYKLAELHPGIPSWFIARNHRFTQNLHWLRGVLFGQPRIAPTSIALVQADPDRPTVDFAVRGLLPQGFLSILTDSFEDTVTRLYPGMTLVRVVPCPTPNCEGSVALADLESLLENHRSGHRKSSCWECPTCQSEHEIETLLVGLTRAPGHLELAERIVRAVHHDGNKTREHVTREMAEARVWMQNLFVSEWNEAQLIADLTCPSVIAFYPTSGRGLLYERTFCLQLYCMCPDGWHGVGGDGLVKFRPPKEWWASTIKGIQRVARWVKPVATLLPLLGAVAGETVKEAGEWAADAKNELDLTAKFCEQWEKVALPEEWGMSDKIDDVGRARDWSNEMCIQNIKKALAGLDFPVKPYGGLIRHRTRDNKILWLCDKHFREIS